MLRNILNTPTALYHRHFTPGINELSDSKSYDRLSEFNIPSGTTNHQCLVSSDEMNENISQETEENERDRSVAESLAYEFALLAHDPRNALYLTQSIPSDQIVTRSLPTNTTTNFPSQSTPVSQDTTTVNLGSDFVIEETTVSAITSPPQVEPIHDTESVIAASNVNRPSLSRLRSTPVTNEDRGIVNNNAIIGIPGNEMEFDDNVFFADMSTHFQQLIARVHAESEREQIDTSEVNNIAASLAEFESALKMWRDRSWSEGSDVRE
jgi:hypothetical protein